MAISNERTQGAKRLQLAAFPWVRFTPVIQLELRRRSEEVVDLLGRENHGGEALLHHRRRFDERAGVFVGDLRCPILRFYPSIYLVEEAGREELQLELTR
ncbi:hypothetical protein [Rhizobium calliandrae]|uniref:hypothetical protein n=1 Tax=Rhizobium calliandrae TaxID=1312182 RepID=UPI0032E3AA5D